MSTTTDDMRAQIASLKSELAEADERVRFLKEEVRTHRSIHPQVDAVMSQFGDATTAEEQTRNRWSKETAKKRQAQWLELLQAETAPRRPRDTASDWAATLLLTLLFWIGALSLAGIVVWEFQNFLEFRSLMPE